jgi:hypothetical protein
MHPYWPARWGVTAASYPDVRASIEKRAPWSSVTVLKRPDGWSFGSHTTEPHRVGARSAWKSTRSTMPIHVRTQKMSGCPSSLRCSTYWMPATERYRPRGRSARACAGRARGEPKVANRRAAGSITDLAEAGYVITQKDGRRNRYRVQAHLAVPEPGTREPPSARSSPCSPPETGPSIIADRYFQKYFASSWLRGYAVSRHRD